MRKTPDQFVASLGFPEAYRVGGSVRDELLGRRSKDTDYVIRGADLTTIATALAKAGAKPSSLKLRGNGPLIGVRASTKEYGLLEIVLPRTEISTGPGRHDFDIHVGKNITLAEDAVRRDFTINALYKNVVTGEIYDPLSNGKLDLKKGIISTCHENSFAEDPLRILRALRFVSALEFTVNLGTWTQLQQHANAVTGLTQKGVSGTALEELSKLLMGKSPGYAMKLMADSGVLSVFLPELAPMVDFDQRSRYHDKSTSDHTWACLEAAAAMHQHAPLRVRMALLFHDSGKPQMYWTDDNGLDHYYAIADEQIRKFAETGQAPNGHNSLYPHEYWSTLNAKYALTRLNAPSKLRKDVCTLVEEHMLPIWDNIKPFKIRKLRAQLGDELLRDLITHRTCDVLGKGGDTAEQIETLEWIANEQTRAAKMNVPRRAKELKIDGKELMELGYKGRAIGEIQGALLHEVIAQPDLNNNEWLLKRARGLA